MKIKKTALLCALFLFVSAIGACGKGGNGDSGKINVVCTTFPQYDWVRELIAGVENDFEVSFLIGNGTDLHSYNPSAADIVKISNSDLFIYVGGESDEWVEEVLEEETAKNVKALNMMEIMGSAALEEEIKEGMQAEEEEEGEEGEEGEEEGPELDEHVWLSVRNAEKITAEIGKVLCSLSGKNADKIMENEKAYLGKLDRLDKDYEKAANAAPNKTVVFGDRFPFRYMVEDYGLDYFAAFVGCSAESEASFETIAFLSGKVDELKLNSILVIENSDKKIAEAVRSNTKNKNAKILVMNSLQSLTKNDIDDGLTYLGVMTDNLNVLKEALK